MAKDAILVQCPLSLACKSSYLLGKLIELYIYLENVVTSLMLGKLWWLIPLYQPLSSCYHHSSIDHSA